MKKISLLLSLMIAFSLTAQTDVMRKRVDNEKALTVVKKAQVQEGRQIQKAAYAPSSVTSLLNEGFNGSALPTGWTITDSDGDGFNWEVIDSLIIPSHSGSGAIFSASYDNTVGVLTPDNLLESPSIAVPSGAGTTLLEFYVAGVDNSYSAEYYDVLVRQGSNTPVVVFSETLANNIWKKNIINLSA